MDLFLHYCKLGRVDAVKNILREYRFIRDIPQIWRRALEQACRGGHKPMFIFLHAIIKSIDYQHFYEVACESGNLELIMYIENTYNLSDVSTDPIYHACCHGHLHVAMYLLLNKSYRPLNLHEAICGAFAYGNDTQISILLLLAKFLGDIPKYDQMMIDAMGRSNNPKYIKSVQIFHPPIHTLHCACWGAGNMEIVEYLLSLIPPSYNLTYMAASACYAGHLHVVKRLLQAEHLCNISECFNNACKGGQVHIIGYLHDKYPTHCEINLGVYYAMLEYRYNAIKFLLPHITNGLTPLRIFDVYGLLNCGINPTVLDAIIVESDTNLIYVVRNRIFRRFKNRMKVMRKKTKLPNVLLQIISEYGVYS